MTYLAVGVICLLLGCWLDRLHVLVKRGGRKLEQWAARELETQDALRRRSRQLDASWCSACGFLGGDHAADCEYVLEVRRS